MSSPYEASAEFQPPARRRRIWPWILSGCAVTALLVIAACGGLLYLGFTQVSGHGEISLEVDELFHEIAQGRAAEFYRDRTAPEFKKAMTEQAFLDMCQSLNQDLGKLQSKSATGFSVRNLNLQNYVDATYDCQFEQGEGTVKVGFVHDRDQWLLRAFYVDSPLLAKAAARLKCPHCGEPYEAGDKFCPHCGKELPAE